MLERYLERIGVEAEGAPNAETLARLQVAHRLAVPFENLDILLGRGISLDPDALTHKLIDQRRGGYCFEQNGLFLSVLRATGFEARPLLARVWLGAEETPARTHTLNLVRLDGEDHIVDVGFGGSLMPVMPLVEDAPIATPDGVRHRLVRDAEHGWLLERNPGAGWNRQYSFNLDTVWPVDLETANHWTATRPGTRFTTLRVASRPLPDGFTSLVDRNLNITRKGESQERPMENAEEYRRTLSERFGLDLDESEVAALGLF